MKRTVVKIALLAVMLAMTTTTAWAYDEAMAESYAQYFEGFAGKETGKALQLMGSSDLMDAVKAGEDLFVLDVRTPAETGVYALTIAGSVAIPMNEVFKPENLARIPEDKKVVVVCRGSLRALAVATGLRHIGFDDVYVLAGGTMGLADYLTPKTAH
jgi:rhodanese-related sulfurtransferase